MSGTNGNNPAKKPARTPEEIAEARRRQKAGLRPPFSSTDQPAYNPGRPRKDHPLMRELRRALREKVTGDPQQRTCYRLICQSIVRKAIKGDVDAAKLVFERQLGRVRDAEEFDRPTAIVVQVVTNRPREFAPRDPEDGGPPMLTGGNGSGR